MNIKLLLVLILFSTLIKAQYTKLLDFAGNVSGKSPNGDLFLDGTFLYGMTSLGGTNNNGVIFKIKSDGTAFTKLIDFMGASNGSTPNGSLIFDGTFLYGMTDSGGTNNLGTILKIKTDGTGYVKLLDFTGVSNGSNPWGSLFSDGTFLYGMTQRGGTNNSGVIFKIKSDGTGYVKLHDFGNTSDGTQPLGSLISDGTFLYGMTQFGGVNNSTGTVFKIKPDGTSYTTLYSFGYSPDGFQPVGSLFYNGTFLYGMTGRGGTVGNGTIFKIMPDGTGYVRLSDLSGTTSGNSPWGSFISDGTFLYGMSQRGGGAGGGCGGGCGAAFRIKPDGTGYTNLLAFNNATNGRYPMGSFISSGSFLYGMTQSGGANGDGTIFKLDLTAIGIAENIQGADFNIYPIPFSIETELTLNENLEKATLTVYNSFGQQVKEINNISGKAIKIQRDNLSNGIYFIRLTQDNKVILADKLIITD